MIGLWAKAQDGADTTTRLLGRTSASPNPAKCVGPGHRDPWPSAVMPPDACRANGLPWIEAIEHQSGLPSFTVNWEDSASLASRTY
jgi:hypothetical protein